MSRRRLSRKGRTILQVMFAVLLCVFLFSTWKVYTIQHAYRTGNDTYAEIAGKAKRETEDSGETIDFDKLAAINPDVIGWLTLDGTVIDYPVVQGTDNAYYLEHLFNRDVNHMGSLFMDYRSDPYFRDYITPIYGHHTNSGAMFCTLENYKEQAFYDEHPQFLYRTPHGDYIFEAYAGTLMNAEEDFLKTGFADETAYRIYLETFREHSTFVSDTEFSEGDHAVMLLTCTADFENARYVLICRVVPVLQ